MFIPHYHDNVIKWKHFPRHWPFVRGINRSPVNSPHKGQWRKALMFTLICVWINGCVHTREAGDLRRYCAHYGVTVMFCLHVVTKIYGNINTFCDSMNMENGVLIHPVVHHANHFNTIHMYMHRKIVWKGPNSSGLDSRNWWLSIAAN